MNTKKNLGFVLTVAGVFGIGYAAKKTFDNILDDRKRLIPQNDETPVEVENQKSESMSELESDTLIASDKTTTTSEVSQGEDLLTKVRVIRDVSYHVVMPTVDMLVKALTRNQTFLYGCINKKNGYVTGFGYVFETIIRHSSINGYRPVKQSDSYRGTDFLVGEKQYQAKCCCSKDSYERGLFDNNGNYKYGKQNLIVPKGDKEKVMEIFRKHGIQREILEMNVTYEQVKEISALGKWAGVKFDLGIGLRSMWANMALLLGKGILYEVLVTELEYILNKGCYPDREVKRNYRFKRWALPAVDFVGGSLLTYAGFGQFCRVPHVA